MLLRSYSRALISVTLAGAVVLGMVSPAAAAPAPLSKPQPSAAAELAGGELAEAKRTGKPVELADRTTETTQVVVNPNGTFTLRSSARPTRVKRDGRWHDVDTSLRARPDGSLVPAATSADIAFSGGGTTPAVTFAAGDKKLALTWPTPLPKPEVDGGAAVYRDVLPGVDLRLTADVAGFSQVLVVRDAEAASHPRLAQLTMTAEPTGMTLDVAADGTLYARDADGKTVFHGSTPIMWDSALGEHSGPATATDPGSGRVTPLKLTGKRSNGRSANAVELSITPDKAALSGPGVVYPVYIDPFMSRGKDAWAEVTSNGWHYFNNAMDAQVGRCDWSGCGTPSWVARSYFRMGTYDLMPRNGYRPILWDAYFYATQKHAAHACTAEPTELKTAGWIDENTRWPGPEGSWVDTQSSAAGDNCGGAGSVKFNAKSGVQQAIDNSWNTLTLLLRAPDEANKYQWKKFANNPVLEATFSYRPNDPGGLAVVGAVQCAGTLVTPTATPTLHGTGTDNNVPALNLGLTYEVWDHVGSKLYAKNSSLVNISSGSVGAWPVTPALPDGHYAYRVGSQNLFPGDSSKNLWANNWSQWKWFHVRATPLSAAPEIVPTEDYPAGNWGQQAGSPGSVTIEDFTNKDIVGFSYTFDGSGTEMVPQTTDCVYDQLFGTSGGWVSATGRATIQLPTGLTPGYHTMHVKSFDAAHKMSAESLPFTFYVAPNTGGSSTRVEAESMVLTQPSGQNITVGPQSDCCDVVWSGGKQVLMQSTAVDQSVDFAFTVPSTGDPAGAEYQLGIGVTKAKDFGQVAYFVDGSPIGQPFLTVRVGPYDQYSSVVSTEHRYLGTRRLTPGTHKLTIKVTGTNSASTGARYHAGLDYLTFATTSRYEAEQPSQVTPSQPAGQSVTTGVATQNCCSGHYSDGQAYYFAPNAFGQSLGLAFRVPIEADYAMGISVLKGRYTPQLEFSVDGKPVNRTNEVPWDGYDPDGPTSTYIPLGGVHLASGPHTLTVKVVGNSGPSSYYDVTIDYFTAVPINNVTAASFEAAMNNNGIAADGTASAFDLASGGLSTQTLAAVGLDPGKSKVINGATFTMPVHRADGADNIVAIGQTIPLPSPVRASAIGFLATSTCGTSPRTTMTVTYTNGTTQNPVVPEVFDWAGGPTEAALVTLPHRTLDGAPQTSVRPRIWPVFIPVDPSKTLTSVTLPNYGTSLMPGCAQPALHVLAMAVRPVSPGWVGAWGARSDNTTVPPGGAGFLNNTVRTVLTPSATGTSVRVKLANPRATEPMTVGAASVGAHSAGSSTLAAPAALTFSGGAAGVVIPAGGEVLSDPIAFPSTAGGSGKLVVSMHFTTAVGRAPVHPYTKSATYLATGNRVAEQDGAAFVTQVTGTYYLAGVEVSTSDNANGTVVVLGDHFGNGAATMGGTWVDKLPTALAAEGGSVPGGLVNASSSGLPPTGHWKLNESSGSTANNAVGAGLAVTMSPSVTWSSERGGAAVFNGTDGYGSTSQGAVDTTKSYTVSAWVKVNSTSTYYTAVSQGGTNAAAFYLQYNKARNGWTFISPLQDSASPTGYVAVTGPVPTVGAWTHLAGIYDAATGEIALYVNGELIGTAKNPSAFGAAGPLAIGGVKLVNGTVSNQFNGAISDVRIYRTAASAQDIAILYRGAAPTAPAAGIGVPSAAAAAMTIERDALSQPNLRTVVVALGATDILAGKGKDEVFAKIKTLAHPASPTGLQNVRRTDGTLIHVIVATVPPMGLASDDPREQQRRQLNDALLNDPNLGANGVLDLAAIVADPNAANAISPTLLVGTTPNAVFYDTVAREVARAVTGFPPLEL